MLPEITSLVGSMLSKLRGSSAGIQTLGLNTKTMGGLSFDAVNAGWYARNGFPGIYSVLSGGLPAWSGESVSVQTALNHSVVWACNRVISESVGMIPCLMYQRNGKEKQPASKHPMYSALKDAPNNEITAMGFSELITGHAVMQGNGFAKIIRRSGKGAAIELQPLQPQTVFPDRETTGEKRLVYRVKDGNEAEKTYTVVKGQPHDILHIRGLGWDGIRGYSVITMGRHSMGTAIAAEKNLGRFWANGGRLPYYLKLNKDFKTTQEFDQWRANWDKVYSEPHKAPILQPYIEEYKQIGLSMVDAQLLETRQFTVAEICRWFRVAPHMVADLSRATFSNIEQQAIEFVNFTLGSWLKRWEEELWRCVLTDEEKAAGYFFRNDVNALLRGDFKTRMEGYASALQNGHMSVDEVRDLEDRNALPEGAGESYHIQLNMQSLPGVGQPLASQSPQLVRLGPKEKRL